MFFYFQMLISRVPIGQVPANKAIGVWHIGSGRKKKKKRKKGRRVLNAVSALRQWFGIIIENIPVSVQMPFPRATGFTGPPYGKAFRRNAIRTYCICVYNITARPKCVINFARTPPILPRKSRRSDISTAF